MAGGSDGAPWRRVVACRCICTVLWCCVDLSLSSLPVAVDPDWAPSWSTLRRQLRLAPWMDSMGDLWLLSVARCALLLACTLGLLLGLRRGTTSPQHLADVAQRLKLLCRLIGLLALCQMAYSLMKLLGYNEVHPTSMGDARLWLSVGGNLVFAMFAPLVCRLGPVSAAVAVHAASQLPKRSDSTSDTAQLIDSTDNEMPTARDEGRGSGEKRPSKKRKRKRGEDEEEVQVGRREALQLVARMLRYCSHEWPLYLSGFTFLLFYSLGSITSRLTTDCQTMSDTFALNINVFLRNMVMMIGSMAFMFSISWQLSLVTFICVPLVVIASKVYGAYYDRLSEEVQDALAHANEIADEVISSMRTVRSFANESAEVRRYKLRMAKTLHIQLKQTVAYGGYIFTNSLLEMLVLVSVLWYGGHLVLTDRLQGKNLVSFMLYQLQMGDNLTYMGYVWTGLMQAVGASRKVFDYIDRRPAIDTSLGRVLALPRELDASLPAIQFDQVHFSYPSRPDAPVLRGISFSVAAGETVALVGPSGGGKSSCIALLQHFYEPSAGCVLLHGVPIADYEHRALHSLVSLVSQEPVLYGRAIHENIVYGLDEQFDAAVDDPVDEEDAEKRRAFDASVSPFCERVLHAAQLANAHNFIEQQPSGYLTQVGEKGTQMSGGQKQRIAIARALIRSPRVLLLDEATSALDAESEHLVQQAIYSNLSGRTVLLIAHRLSTVERADRIVVVDHGLVVQQGTHKQLLQQDGIYKQLIHRQLLGGHDVIAGTTSSANVAGLGAAAAVDVTKHLPSPVRSTGSYKSFGSASPLSASP